MDLSQKYLKFQIQYFSVRKQLTHTSLVTHQILLLTLVNVPDLCDGDKEHQMTLMTPPMDLSFKVHTILYTKLLSFSIVGSDSSNHSS